MTQDAAQRVASDQCGGTLDTLVARQLAFWCDRIATLTEPVDSRLAGLKSACLTALQERWVTEAVLLGWDEASIFGLDPNAPARRDGNGLMVRLATAESGAPLRVVGFEPGVALVSTDGGSIKRHFNTGHAGLAIWEHPALRRLH